MRRTAKIPIGWLDRLGGAGQTVAGVPSWRAIQIAWAIRVSEQTVTAWARAGRIPMGDQAYGNRWWTMDELILLDRDGILEIGHYFPRPLPAVEVPPPEAAVRRSRKTNKKGRGK